MSSLPSQPLLTPLPRRRSLAGRLLRGLRIALESLALLVVIALAAAPWLSGIAWPVDLVANFTAQSLFLTAALLGWAVLLRRWKLLALTAIAGLAQVLALAGPRADWAEPSDAVVTRASSVRILHMNANPLNERPGDALDFIAQCDADIVCITEPPMLFSIEIYQQRRFAPTHPHLTRLSPKDYASFQYVLSRWPAREFPNGADETGEPPLMALVVDHPAGPFGLILIHPASPRREQRWRVGNQLVRDAAAVVSRMRAEGLEVILTADLNGAPGGYRSTLLGQRTDLRRTKPLWRAEGTFPSGRAWPAAIVLDDVWISPALKAASWEALFTPGSDHRSVMAEIVLPARP